MLLAVAAAEEAQDLIGAGPQRQRARPRSDNRPSTAKSRCDLMSSQTRRRASCAIPYRVQKRPLSSSRSVYPEYMPMLSSGRVRFSSRIKSNRSNACCMGSPPEKVTPSMGWVRCAAATCLATSSTRATDLRRRVLLGSSKPRSPDCNPGSRRRPACRVRSPGCGLQNHESASPPRIPLNA